MLHFDGTGRAKIDELFARLPADHRARLVSPAQLVAAVTTAAIPIGNAQLVWQVQDGPDEAEACVWIILPDYRPLDSSTAPQRPSFDVGPTWRPAQKKHGQFFASPHRRSLALVVSMSAVAKIEKEIGGLK